jgi:urea carboxylase
LISELSATVASISSTKTARGYRIESADDVLLVLDAMKTDIEVVGGEENVGRIVKELSPEICVGKVVSAGDVLVTFEN